ncbi:MAG: regulatory protein RecX [Balneolaceae bacterium]
MDSRKFREEPDLVEGRLPLRVTSILPQKKKKDRFSLFHEEEFMMGVSGKSMLDFSIQKGVEMTPFLYNRLKESEEYQKVKESFYRYLAGRDHSSFELRQKGRKKGFRADVMDNVLEELEQKNLLSDESFARKFALDKANLKQWGPKKIKNALCKKGIGRAVAKKVVQNVAENLEQDQICVDLALKRKRHFLRENDPFRRKQKIYTYLAGKGYSGTVISKALPVITKKLDA